MAAKIHLPHLKVRPEIIETLESMADERGVSRSEIYGEALEFYINFQVHLAKKAKRKKQPSKPRGVGGNNNWVTDY